MHRDEGRAGAERSRVSREVLSNRPNWVQDPRPSSASWCTLFLLWSSPEAPSAPNHLSGATECAAVSGPVAFEYALNLFAE
jgi:hypothetical protein